MRIRQVGPEDLDQWQAFVDAAPNAGPHHHAAWFHVLRESFAVKPCFLQANDDDGRVVGVLPMFFSSSVFTGPHLTSLWGGVLSATPEAANALHEEAFRVRDRLGAHYFLARGGTPCDRPADKEMPTVETWIPVDCTPEEAMARVNYRTRQGIRYAQRDGLTIESGSTALPEFYQAFASNMRDLGTPVFSVRMFLSMQQRLGQHMRLFVVRLKDRVIGGMICVLNRGSWTGLNASIIPECQPLHGNYLLYSTIIAEACQADGVSILNLGTSIVNSGNHQFKQKWRGYDVQAPYRFYFAPAKRPRIFVEEIKSHRGWKQRIWSRLPLPVANAVGPLLRRQLPFA